MAGPHFDGIERQQLAGLLDELGPAAPTLLPPWTTRDLTAHLVLRERDPLAAPGLVLGGPWGRFALRRQQTLARSAFPALVARFRSGPPPGFFRLDWVREFPTLNEFFVHHEDVRRANGCGPRTISPDMNAALWRNVRRASRFLARRVRGAGVELQWSGTDRRVRIHGSEPMAHIIGPPGELLLFLFGRKNVAHVDVTGSARAVQAVRKASFGM